MNGANTSGEKWFVKLHFTRRGLFAESVSDLSNLPTKCVEKTLQVCAFSLII
ncbi:DUF5951 family protein [Enterobacter sp.]|uniref:DUF5951 family protein n=1 Tax=Enterobacter sp. TaxID=42895 RepID=UPI0039928B04